MKPKDRKERYARLGGSPLGVADVNDNPIDLTTAHTENGTTETSNADGTVKKTKKSDIYTDEEIKIMALKLAISMAKLFSDITTENIVELASTAASFIKYHELAH